MNVNAVGPSDEHDIRKAAIEAAMLDKEPPAQERAVETQRKLLNQICGTEDHGMLRDAIKPADLAALFAQIKSQADRIASDNTSQQICVGAAGVGDFSELCGWIDATKQRIAELEKDAKRLDWMDATAFTAYHHRDAEGGNLNLYSVVVNEDAENRIGKTGPFIRDAIDAAMNERKE